MTRNTLGICALAAVTAAGTLMVGTNDADAARRTAMGGTPLVQDFDDVYMFPQSVLGEQLVLDMDVYSSSGAYGTSGSGGLLLGNDSMAVGIFTHRFDSQFSLANGLGGNPGLAGPGDAAFPGAGLNAGLVDLIGPAPLQWFDLVFAADAGGNAFGARLSVALGSSGSSTEASYSNDGGTASSSSFLLDLVAGFRLSSDSSTTDLAAEIGIVTSSSSGENLVDNLELASESSSQVPAITLAGRHLMNQGETLDFGAFGAVGFGSSRTNTNTAETTADPSYLARATGNSTFFLMAGAGPVYDINGRARVTGDASFAFIRYAEDPWVDSEEDGVVSNGFDDDKTIETSILFPSVRVGGEFNVSRTLVLRSGFRSNYSFNTTTVQERAAIGPFSADSVSGDGDDTKDSSTSLDYIWTAGMGLDFGEFQVDAVFDTSFLTRGPNFISGAAGDLFAMLSMRYTFGRERATETTTGESAPSQGVAEQSPTDLIGAL